VKRERLVDVAKIKQEVLAGEQTEREERAQRYLLGIEISVLGAMIMRYDAELFADVEEDDFFSMPHKCIFGALRALELGGKDVDGEFLIADLVAELDRVDREHDKCVRAYVTDEFLRQLVAPRRHVVPARDRASIAFAIAELKAIAIARTDTSTAVEVLDAVTNLRRRE
jgi:hypothetical protein